MKNVPTFPSLLVKRMQAPHSDSTGMSMSTYSDPIPTKYFAAFVGRTEKLEWQLQLDSVKFSFFSKTSPPKNSHQVQMSRSGHSSKLQGLVWRSRCLKQEDLAPKTTSLSLCWSPPPHVTEQALHSVHWVGVKGQGHGSELQLCTIVTFSRKQEAPMLLTTLLLLVCAPWLPQVWVVEHSDQGPHSVGGAKCSQGQDSTLQLFDSLRVWYWQTVSPQPVMSTFLVRMDFPPPQGSEHSLQLVQSLATSHTVKEMFC